MYAIVPFAIVVLCVGFFYLSGGRTSAAARETVRPGWLFNAPLHGERSSSTAAAATATTTAAALRNELIARLEKLRSSPPPKNLMRGTMCYKPAYFNGTQDLICSHCKKKSVVKRDWSLRDLESCQRLVTALQKVAPDLHVQLDTRGYCAECQREVVPDGADQATIAQARRLHLLVRMAGDDTSLRRRPINSSQLRALKSFLEGNARVPDRLGKETRATKSFADDIADILGLE